MVSNIPEKIAFLLPCLKFGGAERVALNLALALRDKGSNIDILLMSAEGEFLSEAKNNFNVINLECNRTYKLPFKLFSYMKKHKADVLISSFWKLNLCACLNKLVLSDFNLILWEHSPPTISKNSPTWLYAISSSILYRVSNRIIAVSTGVFNSIVSCTIGLQKNIEIIFNPILPPDGSLLVKNGRQSSVHKTIISVGRLDEPKNPKLLLEAFALVAKNIDATLLIVGDGVLRMELEDRCRFLGLVDRVKFMGYHPDPYKLMVTADLLVVSSDREGLPGVIIEAMYCGLRVVSTACGEGVKDILLDDHYGTIVPLGDKHSLAKAMETELLTDNSVEDQKAGAQRFMPGIISDKFLALMS